MTFIFVLITFYADTFKYIHLLAVPNRFHLRDCKGLYLFWYYVMASAYYRQILLLERKIRKGHT